MTASGEDKSQKKTNSIQFTSPSTTGSVTTGLIFDTTSSSSTLENNGLQQISFPEFKDQEDSKVSKAIDFKTSYNNYYPNNNNEIFLEKKLSKYYSTLKTNFKNESKQSETKLFNHLKAAQSSLDLSVNKVLDELKEVRNSVLGTIALFAAFFTFVSVNVNIFTKAESVLHALLFMFSMWLCIIGLISTFFYFLNSKKELFFRPEFIITIICIILSGVVIYYLSIPVNNNNNKILKEQLEELTTQNKKIISTNENLNKQIELLKEDIFNLKRNQPAPK